MITLSAAAPEDLRDVQGLLAANALPSEDIVLHFEHFVVARSGETLVGVAGLEYYGASALLRSLCVAEPVRGQGVGRGLCDEVESRAGAMAVRDLYLLTTTAQRFFEGRGFTVIDRTLTPEAIRATAEFQFLCPSTAVCMHKQLLSRTWVGPPGMSDSAGDPPAAPA
jgi:amino-acid N-acetyltransferase